MIPFERHDQDGTTAPPSFDSRRNSPEPQSPAMAQAATHSGEQAQFRFHASKYRPEFAQWLSENHHIWSAFCREANRVWDRGRRHYSARTLIEYLRHETALREDGGAFKVNNNAAPDLARLYADTFPERASLFEMRLPHNSKRAA